MPTLPAAYILIGKVRCALLGTLILIYIEKWKNSTLACVVGSGWFFNFQLLNGAARHFPSIVNIRVKVWKIQLKILFHFLSRSRTIVDYLTFPTQMSGVLHFN